MRKAIYRLLLIINKIALVALLVAYLSPEIRPSVFNIPAFLGLAYSIILFINVGFVLFWILKRKWAFLISLPFLIINYPYTQNVVRMPWNRESSPSGIKIFSYNVRMFDLHMWSGYRFTRSRAIKYVIGEQPDIVFFQEYFSKSNNEHSPSLRFRKEAGLEFFCISQIHDSTHRGLAIFSRYPILRHQLAKRDGRSYAMLADLLIGADTIRCINVHLQSVGLSSSNYNFIDSLGKLDEENSRKGVVAISKKLSAAYEKRSFQAQQIRQFIETSPYKVLLAGDFNDTPNSYTYHQIRNHLRDAFVDHGVGFGATYERFGYPLRIDYIMGDSTMHLVNFRTHTVDFSDHHPISCYLALETLKSDSLHLERKIVLPPPSFPKWSAETPY